MGNRKKAQDDDLIKIINRCGAMWIEKDEVYYVGKSSNMELYNKDKTPIWYIDREFVMGWSCNTWDYEIMSRAEDYYEIY